jgi:nucleoside-diphosphate-sugar epimerase
VPDIGTVGITGASGFIGSALTRAFSGQGVRVVAFVRDPAQMPAAGKVLARPYTLDAKKVPDLDGIDILVHCAFAPRVAGSVDAVATNVDGTMALYRAAGDRGVRFAFMSSISALGRSESAYARQKRAIEERLGVEALVFRPGLVIGKGGFFETVLAATHRPVVPLIDGGHQMMQVVAIDDLCSAVWLALGNGLCGAHNIVSDPPLALRTIVRTLLDAQERRAFLLTVPYAAAFAVASIAERLGVALPVTTESLRGLEGARLQAPSAAMHALGWSPVPPSAVLKTCASKWTA